MVDAPRFKVAETKSEPRIRFPWNSASSTKLWLRPKKEVSGLAARKAVSE
jgi:hypothetical protein